MQQPGQRCEPGGQLGGEQGQEPVQGKDQDKKPHLQLVSENGVRAVLPWQQPMKFSVAAISMIVIRAMINKDLFSKGILDEERAAETSKHQRDVGQVVGMTGSQQMRLRGQFARMAKQCYCKLVQNKCLVLCSAYITTRQLHITSPAFHCFIMNLLTFDCFIMNSLALGCFTAAR